MYPMNEIATFEKVSFKQFFEDCVKAGFKEDYYKVYKKEDTFTTYLFDIYNGIKLPTRATTGSAGYDFYLPMSIELNNVPLTVPTGIRCKIEQGWFLLLVPRSSLGFKYGMRLENTAGIIDSDYYYADNEGHIQTKISTANELFLSDEDRFIQGIFIPYGITIGDEATAVRTGGFGSTNHA